MSHRSRCFIQRIHLDGVCDPQVETDYESVEEGEGRESEQQEGKYTREEKPRRPRNQGKRRHEDRNRSREEGSASRVRSEKRDWLTSSGSIT